MDVTLYLPDEIGLWAKSAGVNLSGTLRAELEALKVRAEALVAADEVRLDLVDRDGNRYVGRFTGTLIAEGREASVYLTEDDRILVHDWKDDAVEEVEHDEEALRDRLDHDAYIEACNALGFEPVLDI